jgi:hypothetical protein
VRERDCLEDIVIDGRIILKWILTFSGTTFLNARFLLWPEYCSMQKLTLGHCFPV